ncbi:MAG: Eco47II family restriction endonuclease [Comamonas sp.]|nr:Eco47II family restriction endonuclease [Comamonas sp.]
MSKYSLGFISDKDLYQHIQQTVEKYRFQVDLAAFNKNLIDPIKLTFDTKVYQREIADVISDEVLRQLDKSNNNHIGYFHQNIFHYLGDGWFVPEKGYDIVHLDKQIYVEMKNKHNTMNSSSAQKTYMRMQNTILQNPNACCMLVEIIAKDSQNIPWAMSLDGQHVSHEKIRRVSIDKFYELVTGQQYAFRDLCQVLPIVIEDVVANMNTQTGYNTVLAELYNISPHILQSLYQLAFARYEGFSKFHL